MATQIPQRVLDAIWERVDVRGPDECWPWKLSISTHGYGQVGWGGNGSRGHTTAHRAAWTAANGPIPGDLTVDHLCRNRPCCNPAHLRLLTNGDNASDNGHSTRTHCPSGHKYDEANTYLNSDGHRFCRACNRIRSRGRDRKGMSLRGPIHGRRCVECAGPIDPGKRAHAIYCDRPCAMRAAHRRQAERAS